MRFFFIAFLLLTGWALQCNAQVADTALQRRDTVASDTLAGSETVRVEAQDTSIAAVPPGVFQPRPKKAGLYSALVPGLGQIYNHDYWKVPLIYAGVGVAGGFIISNLTKYLSYRQAYIGRINNPNPTDKYVGIYDTSQLKQLQNDYSKYLDLTVMLTVVGYGIQVLDAVTSAHLKNFDISRDISMKCRPIILPNFAGLSLTIKYKYARKDGPGDISPDQGRPPGGG